MSDFIEAAKSARPRTAIKPPTPKAPLVDTSKMSPSMGMMADIVNNTAAPFQEAPDPKRGDAGWVEHKIGAVMGIVGAPFELLDTGFALVTAPLAALMPGFPAAVLGMPHLGTMHGHAHPPSLIPPNPVPTPLPSIGTVLCAGCVSVTIGGVFAARAGDLGLALTCFSFGPPFEIYTGSSNTWIGGSRAARMLDITRHCNPASKLGLLGAAMGAVGVAAGFIGSEASSNGGEALQASMQAAQAAADAVALAMSALLGIDPGLPPSTGAILLGNPTVLIGGFPVPDLLDLLGALLKGLKKVGSKIGNSPTFKKLIQKVGLCNDKGEPVSSFTGAVYNDFDDYLAPNEFAWGRHYKSSWNLDDGPLGPGFRHFYDRRLQLLRKRAVYETHDGELVAFPRDDKGGFLGGEGYTLTRLATGRYQLITDRDEELEFVEQPTFPPTGRLVRYEKGQLELFLSYNEDGWLRTITESVGAFAVDTRLVYEKNGRIIEVQRGPRDASPLVIARYFYDNDCLVAWQDALGATVRMRYDVARRMVQLTDRRGYSFHWQYDPHNGRCIKGHGDDGLWGIEARYEGDTSVFKEADGGEWTFKHFPDGIVSHILDPLGGVLEYVRDKQTGRIVKQILPGGTEYSWVYDSSGKHLCRLDAWANPIPIEEDDPSRPDPLRHDGPSTQKGWHCGRPMERLARSLSGLPAAIFHASSWLGLPTSAEATPSLPTRDAMERITEERHPDGFVERYQYDAEANLIGKQDARGNWLRREITSWDLLGAESTPLGNTTRYTYTHREQWRSLTDANGNCTEYVRDQLHRVKEVRHNGTPFVRYVRDAHDRVVKTEAGDGSVLLEGTTNAAGLPASLTLASGQSYEFDYDPNGNLVKASSDAHEIELRRKRRYFFHPTPSPELDVRDGKGIRHGHDSLNELRHTVYFERFAVEYRNVETGRLRVFTPDGSHHDFWRTAFPLRSPTESQVVRENGNGTTELTIFDHEERLAARLCWHHERPLDGPTWTTRYHYDGTNRLTSYVDSDDGPVGFEYDADGRLASANDARGRRVHAYDAAGNLTQTPDYRIVEHDAKNVVNHADFDHFSHDERGRLVTRDQQGGSIVEYSYDSLDQLIEVRWSDRPELWNAGYDGLGRRIWREYGGRRTDFYWDGDRLAAERGPGGGVRLYVYANTDALLPFMWLDYDSEAAPPESGKPHYVFYAPNGIPLRVEDGARRSVWRAKTVDSYGQVEVAPHASTDLRLRFTGHFYDEHLGLFYNRFRDYDPKLGRYLQLDPIGHEGGINLYAYSTNPWVEVDLRGLTVHRKKKPKKPPHADTPLNDMNEQQMKDVCKFHADALADAQEPRPKRRNMNTFSVGVIESIGPDGKPQRRIVATNNMNTENRPNGKAREHMEKHGIQDAHGTPPQVTRIDDTKDGKPSRTNVNPETGEVIDKKAREDHHAEQRMGNVEKAPDENLVAQSPSQGCCDGCHAKLSQPDSNGNRPIDQIPADRQRRSGSPPARSD